MSNVNGKAHLMSVSSMAMLNRLAHNVLAALLLGPEQYKFFLTFQQHNIELCI